MRCRVILINGSLLACSFVVACFLGEGALRLLESLEPCRALGSIPHEKLWAVRPANQDFETDCGEYKTRYTTNSHGWRGPEFPSKSHPDHKRVLVLGDSFVEAIEVEEDERFGRLIDTDLGDEADSVVMGFRSSNPVHALAHYTYLGWQYEPDVVVHSFYSVNDIIETNENFEDLHPHENWRLKLGRKSLLVQLVYDRVVRPIRLSGEPEAPKTASQAAGPFYKFTKSGYAQLESIGAWDMTRTIMKELQEAVELDQGAFIVVMIPPHFLVHEERKAEMKQMLGEYIAEDEWDFTSTYERVIQELRAEGIEVIDALPALKKAHADGERIYFAVDPHITVRGHRAVTDAIMPRVTELLGL